MVKPQDVIVKQYINIICSIWKLFLYFIFIHESVYFICCCCITNTVNSVAAHKLNQIHMNNQEKFTTRPRKFKVHKANSQTISSCPDMFSIYSLFFSFFCFFCLLVFFCFVLGFFFFFFFFFKLKIYILIHIWLCERVSNKKIFTRPISGNKTNFFFGLT